MTKFNVCTSFTQHGVYIVKAKNKQEAEEKFWDGDWESYEDDPKSVIDSQEEILEILPHKEITKTIKKK